MSLYQLHAAMYRYLNPTDATPLPLEPATIRERFELDDRELAAFVEADIAELYRLGVHPVLLNSYARARMSPPEYRAILATLRGESRRMDTGY